MKKIFYITIFSLVVLLIIKLILSIFGFESITMNPTFFTYNEERCLKERTNNKITIYSDLIPSCDRPPLFQFKNH